MSKRTGWGAINIHADRYEFDRSLFLNTDLDILRDDRRKGRILTKLCRRPSRFEEQEQGVAVAAASKLRLAVAA